MKSKPFIVANVRDILDPYNMEEISFSRMVELLNEKAFEFFETKQIKLPHELHYVWNTCIGMAIHKAKLSSTVINKQAVEILIAELEKLKYDLSEELGQQISDLYRNGGKF